MRQNNQHKRNRASVSHSNRRLNIFAFTGIALIVLGLAGVLLFNAFYRAPLPVAGNVIDIAADMGGFDKDVIRVKVGDPVTIRLRSLDNSHHTDGGGKHQWAVDEFNANVVAPPEGTAMMTFTPTEPGTYVFYCDICCGGRANPTMNGKLIVEG
ncbi:cupredoxin domain-containing protein [Anaerolinea sp.]|jgi:heme/copper-type cytochrome/quinol oxidase subunit 2|uniref:cupredoxin domain-containing protein n=1 Tax=Anaerolinea sp. TaxID=1872519 RepID=UPI002ACD6AC8|nr:cupredoxin domain-containing protein [Anaerolinea sp.]